MGAYRFATPPREQLQGDAIDQIYIAGLDCLPTFCRKTWESPELLRLERDDSESARVYVPWHVEGHGRLLLCTATLMERDELYDLTLELARGTLSRLRTKAEAWKLAGLCVPTSLATDIQAACRTFIGAVARRGDAAATEAAGTTIRRCLDAVAALGGEYARQALRYRGEVNHPLPTLLAGDVGNEPMPVNAEPMFRATFNAAYVPVRWSDIQTGPDQWDWTQCDRQVQWCYRNGLKIIAGPLVRLDRTSVPAWVSEATADHGAVAKAARRLVEAAVDRYRNQVHLWHAVATSCDSRLSEDQKLRLSVSLVDAARRQDPRTPVFVSVDQPFGESAAIEDGVLTPLQFVDFLLRAGADVAAIGLEIDYGYWPHGVLPRDVLEVADQIELWALLGLPLITMFTIPSDASRDALATDGRGILSAAFSGGPSPHEQKRLVDQLFPALLAKQSVQALVWSQVFDSLPHRLAHAGLFNGQSLPKPALSSLLALRREHLA